MIIYIIFICAILVALVDICILNYRNRKYKAFINYVLEMVDRFEAEASNNESNEQ